MAFSVKFNKNDKNENGEKINNMGVNVGIDDEKISIKVEDEKHSNTNFELETDVDTIKKGIDAVKAIKNPRGQKMIGNHLLGEFSNERGLFDEEINENNYNDD